MTADPVERDPERDADLVRAIRSASGPLPDAAMRRRIVAAWEAG